VFRKRPMAVPDAMAKDIQGVFATA
jgi:hypothetical protein